MNSFDVFFIKGFTVPEDRGWSRAGSVYLRAEDGLGAGSMYLRTEDGLGLDLCT